MSFNIKSGHKGFVLIMLIGVVLLATAVTYHVLTEGKIKHWTHTEAKVTGYEREYKENSDGERELMYRTILEYTVDDTRYEAKGMSVTNVPPLTGVIVKIAYNPESPEDFIEIGESNSVKILLYVIGGILTCAGVVLFLASCRSNSAANETEQQ